MVACAVVLSFTFSGNGADWNSRSLARGAFRPMVAGDVDFVIGVNLNKEQAFKVVDAYAELLFTELMPLAGVDEKEIVEAKRNLADFKEEPLWKLPADGRRFLEKSGLRSAEYHWAVLSVSDFKVVEGTTLLGGISLAVAGTIDIEKLISALQQEEDCDVTFESTWIDGVTAWHIVPKKARDVREMRRQQLDPYITSLDGRLVLAAGSREALSTQIHLYRRGGGSGDALRGFSASDGELLHLHISGVGDILRKNVPQRELKALNQVIPNGDELVYGLEDLDVRLDVKPSGMVRDSLRLGTASEKDADSLRTLAKTGLMVLKAQLSQQLEKEPRATNLARNILGELKVGGTGRQFELQEGGFLAIAAGALFPVVSSALLSANGNTMSIQGRKLVIGIHQANIDRMGKADPVWPRTELAVAADDTDDVAGKSYGSSTEYFRALFDTGHYGTTNWNPAVDGEFLRMLWGCGVPGMNGTQLESRNIAWTVAANVTDETPDFIPVLITANFNPSLLLSKWDGKTDGEKRLPIGPGSGAEASPFGNKAVVIVRKSGAAEVIKARHLTYDVLYKKQAFDLTNMNPPLKYLTPTGVVEPGTSMKEERKNRK